jgi:hypothetical protein
MTGVNFLDKKLQKGVLAAVSWQEWWLDSTQCAGHSPHSILVLTDKSVIATTANR